MPLLLGENHAKTAKRKASIRSRCPVALVLRYTFLQIKMLDQSRKITNRLWVLGIISAVVYAVILKLSFSFEPHTALQSRPILLVLCLFGLAFTAYFVGCYFVLRRSYRTKEVDLNRSRFINPVGVVFIFGILFRLILLFSVPIQEVDIYRYIWDGLTVNQGVDPYMYPPQEPKIGVKWRKSAAGRVPDGVVAWNQQQDLDKLVEIAANNQGVENVLGLVHFEESTTPYPPVSQAVFALAVGAVPVTSSKTTFLIATKAAILLFDVAIALLIVLLLKKNGLPTIWSLAYFWCPLILKEFANSGHLDSIAVFFCTAAVVTLTFGMMHVPKGQASSIAGRNVGSLLWFVLSGIALALGVGAKLYPLVIVPLWFCVIIRKGSWRGLVALLMFCFIAAYVCWPYLRHTEIVRQNYDFFPSFVQGKLSLPKPMKERRPFRDEPGFKEGESAGIEQFLKSWEMNDLLFMIGVENLKIPVPTMPGSARSPKPWFSVVDVDTRISISQSVEKWTGKKRSAFWITRQFTLAIFAGIVFWSCFSIIRKCESTHFCRLAFLTLAWFWLLSPTQNPWYWSWALPLVVFARSRIWLVFAVAMMLYYLRFYFDYNFADQFVLGTPYKGVYFFDFVVPWIEFAPLLILLLVTSLYPRKNKAA